MIRSVNNYTGFHDRFDTNRHYISDNKYPVQDLEFLGKYTTLRFKHEPQQVVFNRFIIPLKEYEEYYSGINTNMIPRFFKIFRFDAEKPNKAILISTHGEVIVTSTDKLKELLDLKDAKFYTIVLEEAEFMEYPYAHFNEPVTDPQEFFNEYNNEFVNIYPTQNNFLFGKKCYIEFEESLDLDKSVVDIHLENNHEFTPEMRERLIKGDNRLANIEDKYLDNYPYRYDVHGQSDVDVPRRNTQQGFIIRSDNASPDPYVVIMETSGLYGRFYCDDEAYLYVDTENDEICTDVNTLVNSKPIFGLPT